MNTSKFKQELKTSKRKCPICGSIRGQKLSSFDIDDFDESMFSGKVVLFGCENCGFVFNDSDSSSDSYDNYYENESFYFTDTSFATGGSTEFDRNRYSLYYKILRQYLDNNMFIVDIGCGKGGLLSFFQEKGFNNLVGVEIDQRLVNIALREFGLNVKKGSATDFPHFEEKIDIICVTHVLEHLYDLESAILTMKSQLKDNGLVFIEVPDASMYFNGRVFDFYWLAMREHINHFDPWHLEMLMTKYGFKKEYMLQSLVSYDANYAYPSLIMLFRKTSSVLDFVFNSDLIESIKIYMSKESENLSCKKLIIDELISNQKEICIWGVGLEFFILYSMTDLKKCNIKCLIDKNPIKQTKKVDNIQINPPEFLKNLSYDNAVLVTSVFRKEEMLIYLKEIGFGGEIIVLV